MVKLVLRNLLANALKFTHPGGRVEVLAERGEDETVITVRDNGVGLSEENLERVFRIDFPLKTKGTASETGSGLGLILCKEFVEKNNGHIWASSKPGQGSSFSFSLPSSDQGLQVDDRS
jgi:signal transduction histidine kinase